MAVGGIPDRGLPDRGWPDRGIPYAPLASAPAAWTGGNVVLFEFGVSTAHGFFLNEEPGIWRYRWYVSEEVDHSYEIGAFCYGAYEGAG